MPAELNDGLAPTLETYAGEEPLRSRLRAVRAFPWRKSVFSWIRSACIVRQHPIPFPVPEARRVHDRLHVARGV